MVPAAGNNNNKAIYEKSKPQNVGKIDFTKPFYEKMPFWLAFK